MKLIHCKLLSSYLNINKKIFKIEYRIRSKLQTLYQCNSRIVCIKLLVRMICIIEFFVILSTITVKSEFIPEQTSQIYENVTVAQSTVNDHTFDIKIEDLEIIQIFMYHSKR